MKVKSRLTLETPFGGVDVVQRAKGVPSLAELAHAGPLSRVGR